MVLYHVWYQDFFLFTEENDLYPNLLEMASFRLDLRISWEINFGSIWYLYSFMDYVSGLLTIFKSLHFTRVVRFLFFSLVLLS